MHKILSLSFNFRGGPGQCDRLFKFGDYYQKSQIFSFQSQKCIKVKTQKILEKQMIFTQHFQLMKAKKASIYFQGRTSKSPIFRLNTEMYFNSSKKSFLFETFFQFGIYCVSCNVEGLSFVSCLEKRIWYVHTVECV